MRLTAKLLKLRCDFFQYKLNLAYHGREVRRDLYEETMYNALLGSLDLKREEFLLRQSARGNEIALRLA